jgi:hypothetical protein
MDTWVPVCKPKTAAIIIISKYKTKSFSIVRTKMRVDLIDDMLNGRTDQTAEGRLSWGRKTKRFARE